MKNKMKIISIITGCITFLAVIYLIKRIYKEKEINNLLMGISKLKNNNEKWVPISDRFNRFLLKDEEEADLQFNSYMNSLGWDYMRDYGRSALYSKGSKEMLVKKTELVNGMCVYEWMDDYYIKNQVN